MPALENALIEIRGLKKSFGKQPVLRGVDLKIPQGKMTTIIGRSGCGKTTLLRCLNGLEHLDEGSITLGNLSLKHSKNFERDAHSIRSQVGMVFQSFNLFPHLTILENVTIGPRVVKNMPKAQAEEIGMSYLKKVGLDNKADHYSSQLSGGQQQRAAIARALTLNPKVILYDEPTSALDPDLVEEVFEVMEKLDQEGMTQVVVTHEMAFAKTAADHVVFMEEGFIIEEGGVDSIFVAPQDPRTQKFLRRFLP